MYLSFEQFDINILHVKAYMLEDINSHLYEVGLPNIKKYS